MLAVMVCGLVRILRLYAVFELCTLLVNQAPYSTARPVFCMETHHAAIWHLCDHAQSSDADLRPYHDLEHVRSRSRYATVPGLPASQICSCGRVGVVLQSPGFADQRSRTFLHLRGEPTS